MRKALVDRELLERIVNTNMADYAVIAYQHKEIRAILAQPAEAEGVDVVAWAYSGTLSVLEITREGSCLLTVDVQEGQDTPLVRQSDHLAALSAVTAEVEGLRKDAERYRMFRRGMFDPDRFDADIDAAMAAKEA